MSVSEVLLRLFGAGLLCAFSVILIGYAVLALLVALAKRHDR